MTTAPDPIHAAREALTVVEPRVGVWGTLGAAALAATAALLLAGVMILGPGVAIEDPVPTASAEL
jgi:hypothetical protein